MLKNKCNITKFALEQYNSLKWGIACNKKKNISAILENYVGYLNCSDVDLIVCNPDPLNCSSNGGTTVVTSSCSFAINNISYQRIDNTADDDFVDIIFYLVSGDYSGGTLPLAYVWEFNEDDFEGVQFSTSSGLKLKLKKNKNLDYLITQIKLTITDAIGCVSTKICYYTPSGMQCADNYAACYDVGFLEVTRTK